MAEPKWKRVERLIHQLHTPFAPEGAVVTLDDQIVGRESKGDGLFFVHDWKYTRGPSIVTGWCSLR